MDGWISINYISIPSRFSRDSLDTSNFHPRLSAFYWRLQAFQPRLETFRFLLETQCLLTENTRFTSKTPSSYSGTPENPQIFIGNNQPKLKTLKFLQVNPNLSVEALRFSLQTPSFSAETLREYLNNNDLFPDSIFESRKVLIFVFQGCIQCRGCILQHKDS